MNNKKQQYSRYAKSYYCKFCKKFIPHEEAIMHTAKGPKETYVYPICPNGCVKHRIRTISNNRKFKEKQRNQEVLQVSR